MTNLIIFISKDDKKKSLKITKKFMFFSPFMGGKKKNQVF
jgi:hypothetical protein